MPAKPRQLTGTAGGLELIPALTSVRGIAAVAVLVGHGFWLDGAIAAMAVDCFFVLSGFVLARKYVGALGTNEQIVRFFWARFARLWPAAVFAGGVLLIFHQISGFDVPVGPALAATLTMTQAFWPLHDLVDTVSWSASVECCLYLTLPAIIPLIARYPRSALALGCLTALVAHPFIASPCMGLGALGRAFPEFVGGAAASLVARDRLWRADWVLLLALVFSIAFIGSGAMCAGLVMLIVCLSENNGRIGAVLGLRPFVLLGEASYSIYIFQYAANAPTTVALCLFGITDRAPHAIAFIAAAVGMGILIHRTVEVPARALLLRLGPPIPKFLAARYRPRTASPAVVDPASSP